MYYTTTVAVHDNGKYAHHVVRPSSKISSSKNGNANIINNRLGDSDSQQRPGYRGAEVAKAVAVYCLSEYIQIALLVAVSQCHSVLRDTGNRNGREKSFVSETSPFRPFTQIMLRHATESKHREGKVHVVYIGRVWALESL